VTSCCICFPDADEFVFRRYYNYLIRPVVFSPCDDVLLLFVILFKIHVKKRFIDKRSNHNLSRIR